MAVEPTTQDAVANDAELPQTRKRQYVDLTQDSDSSEYISQLAPKKRKGIAKSSKASPQKLDAEKRPRRWRSHPPTSYTERYERAMSQRMFVLDRKRKIESDPPVEEITMAGTTGNIYTVTVSTLPACSCPDAAKGNQCKHIIYALTRIFKAPAQLRYQLSFLPNELSDIFAGSPLPADELTEEDADSEHPSNRKAITGDCPICFCEMDDDDPKDLVWCKAACGNNLHKACFAQWAQSSKGEGNKVRCVYCRTDWDDGGQTGTSEAWIDSAEQLATLKANARVGEDGYANISHQLGISAVRDSSSYHQPWVRRAYREPRGYGWLRRRGRGASQRG